tara:strand:+ start:27343 stop:27645 length:303 start_codon:yes stop_codon:yes gene_type:complete
MKMLQAFRVVAFIEGITTILLFLVAMPLKYGLGYETLIRPFGMAHGVAWIAYVVAMAVCLPFKGFTIAEWLRTFVFALFPTGTFLNDPLIARRQEQLSRA